MKSIKIFFQIFLMPQFFGSENTPDLGISYKQWEFIISLMKSQYLRYKCIDSQNRELVDIFSFRTVFRMKCFYWKIMKNDEQSNLERLKIILIMHIVGEVSTPTSFHWNGYYRRFLPRIIFQNYLEKIVGIQTCS